MNLFDTLTKKQCTVLRAISLMSARHAGGYVSSTRIAGYPNRSKEVVVKALVAKGLLIGGRSNGGHRLSALAKRHEVQWLKERTDNEDGFQCSRCGEVYSADFGHSPDDIDPNGDYCDTCWNEERITIERENIVCAFRQTHDPKTLEPTGPACGAPATCNLIWKDGRHSPACQEHGYNTLTPEAKKLVAKVVKIS